MIGKKAKSSAAADAGSSDFESDNNGASGDDFEIPPKTTIQKKGKVNGKTVQKSKNEMPSTSKKSSASSEKPKTPVWAANQVLFKAEPPQPPE